MANGISYSKNMTEAQYLALETPVENRFYWIKDRPHIYLNGKCYGSDTVTCADFPASGVAGTQYIKLSTGEVRIWIGGAWVTTVKGVTPLLGAESTDAESATAKQVVDYVAAELAKLPADKFAQAASMDSEHVLTITLNDNTSFTVDLAELFQVAGTSSVAGIVKIGGATVAQVPEKITVAGLTDTDVNGDYAKTDGVFTKGTCTFAYDATGTKWQIKKGETVVVSALLTCDGATAADMAGTYTDGAAESPETATVVYAAAHYASDRAATEAGVMAAIQAAVSAASVNLGSTHADEVVTVSADGTITASGKKSGGATFKATPDANTLATEAGVKAYVDAAKTEANTYADNAITLAMAFDDEEAE